MLRHLVYEARDHLRIAALYREAHLSPCAPWCNNMLSILMSGNRGWQVLLSRWSRSYDSPVQPTSRRPRQGRKTASGAARRGAARKKLRGTSWVRPTGKKYSVSQLAASDSRSGLDSRRGNRWYFELFFGCIRSALQVGWVRTRVQAPEMPKIFFSCDTYSYTPISTICTTTRPTEMEAYRLDVVCQQSASRHGKQVRGAGCGGVGRQLQIRFVRRGQGGILVGREHGDRRQEDARP